MNVSAERVASLHLAHLQKEASVTRGLEDLAKKAVIEDFRQKVIAVGKQKATKASNKGWAWVLKSEGASLVQVVQDANKSNSSFNSKDPLTRLLHMSLSKVSDPFEKNRIVGEFSERYEKKDIEGMANVLGVDSDVVTITLLWYRRDVKVASKEAKLRGRRSKGRNKAKGRGNLSPRQRPLDPSRKNKGKPNQKRKPKSPQKKRRQAPSPYLPHPKEFYDKQEIEMVKADIRAEFENYSGFTSKTLKLASYITGGPAVEWLVNLLPRGEILAKPAKWAWWAYLAKNSWTVISTAANWTSVAYNWLISISASSVPAVSGFLKGLKLFLIGGTGWTWFVIGLFVFGSLIFVAKKFIQKATTFGEVVINTTKWQKTKLGFYWVWNAIKSAVSGVLNIGKYVRDEILDYVRENASMFNYMIRKYDIEEDPAPPEINEALAEAS